MPDLLLRQAGEGDGRRELRVEGDEVFYEDVRIDVAYRDYEMRELVAHDTLAYREADYEELIRSKTASLMAAALPKPPITPAAIELFDFENTTALDAVPYNFGFQPMSLRAYLREPTWWDRRLRERPLVAYFSAEYGLAECLPIYSGGLGVLSAHHLKSASDLGVPLVGVGLLYRSGYFRQTVDADGFVEVSPKGDEPGFVHELRRKLREGPRAARVDDVDESDARPVEGLKTFRIEGAW